MSLTMFYFGCALATIMVIAIVWIQSNEDKNLWG